DKKQLKDEDKHRYMELMQSEQKENRYFVRIMIVGRGRVGKTCLLKRLLKERITNDEQSTDGVDIVVQRCKININDGIWTIGKDMSTGMAERFQRAMVKNTNIENIPTIQNVSIENNSSIKELSTAVSDSYDKQSEASNTIETINEFTSPAENRNDLSDMNTISPSELVCSLETVHKVVASSKEKVNKELVSITETVNKELVSNDDTADALKTEGTDEKNMRTSANYTIHNIAKLDKNETKDDDYLTINNAIYNFDENEDENKPLSLIMPKDLMSSVLSKKSNSDTYSNQHALCSLWDFAGQKEFYATHQAFLTSGAVYLVVADIDDDISKRYVTQHFADYREVGGYVDFWFDTIHCHRTAEIPVNKPVNFHIDPPIFIVFTGKDKYEKEKLEKRMKVLQAQLGEVLGNQSKYHHLRDIFCVSNLKDPDDEFEKLREKISEAAQQMQNWGELMPLKWILLEHLIETNKKEKDFVILSDIVKLAKHPDIGMTDIKEAKVFLRFQHKVGNVIFFDDIPDFIILNPQWLVDAFRCLASDRILPSLQHCDDWKTFEQNGQISTYLITELFKSKGGSRFLSQRDNLLKVMEKFDILVKIGEACYIMPSMMPSVPFDTVCEKIGVKGPTCRRTSWLCLKFAFLPPAFFNHFYVWFIRRYKPMEVGNETKSLASLFRGIGVFDINKSKCEKLLITMSTDTIAIQLLSFSTEDKDLRKICSNIRVDLIKQTEVIKERYNLKISYALHFKCSKGDYHKDTLPFEYLKTVSEYSCTEHQMAHRSEEIYMAWMMNATAEKQTLVDEDKTNSRQDDLIPNKTIDRTKKMTDTFKEKTERLRLEQTNNREWFEQTSNRKRFGQTMKTERTYSHLCVVAIDIGTTYSGYAFSLANSYDCIRTCGWKRNNVISMKTPTSLLLDKHKLFMAFGYEAEDKYISTLATDYSDSDSDSDDDDSDSKDEYHYFNRFKMMLQPQTMNVNSTMKDQNGLQMKAIDIFSTAIKYMKVQANTHINRMSKLINKEDIQYVLTVPVTWNDQNKLFMRKAAEKAGIDSKDLMIASEPEAAAIWCNAVLTTWDNNLRKTALERIENGTKYVVVDLGGGTADITVHERQFDGSLEEVIPPSGGYWGGTSVDRAYLEFVNSIFTKKVIGELRLTEPEEYETLLHDFEVTKRTITTDYRTDIVITLPVSLLEITRKHCTSVPEAIQKSIYKESVSCRGHKLSVKPDIFRMLFQPTIDLIVKHLDKLFSHPKLSDLHHILMVGGFSECELVQTAIKQNFPKMKICIPDEAILAVLRGAVLFGYQPKRITGRILPKTYGIQSWSEWDAAVHLETKRVRIDGIDICKDVFYKFAVKGDKVKDGHSSRHIFQEMKTDETTLECTVYTSDDTNPMYVTDPSCKRLGNLVVLIPPLKKGETLEIEKTMIFDGNELIFRARNMKTGEICETQFELLL
ncbi:Hypothetical predicted protein, partial [Mytilus galloprovincialis]